MSRRRALVLLGASLALLAGVAAGTVSAWRAGFAWARDGGHLADWTNRRPERLQVAWQEVASAWPGRVEIRGLRVTGRTARRLWEVRADSVEARLAPLPLLRRELRFEGIRAHGVTFHAAAREAVTATEGALSRLPRGASPSIGGFPPLPVPLPMPSGAPWSFVFRDATLDEVREIWIDDRILRGRITAGGGFELRRRQTATIYPSRIDFGSATAWVGGTPFAHALQGSLRFRTDAYPYRGADMDRVSKVLTGELSLAGDLEADPFVDALLAPWPSLEVETGAVSANGLLVVRRGRLAPPSRLELRQTGQRLRFLGFEARGDTTLEAIVHDGGDSILATEVRFGTWELGRPGEPALLLGQGLRLRAESEPPRWGERPRPLALKIDLGDGRLPDLGFLNAYLPPAAETRIESGQATLGGKLEISGGGEGHGELVVRGRNLRLETRGQRLEGRLEADLRLSQPDLEARSFALDGTRVALKDLVADTSAGERVSGWWGETRLTEARVEFDPPVRLGGAFRARLADTRPLVAFYEVRRDLPGWAERLLTLEGVSASGAFDWRPGRFELLRSEVPLPRGEFRTRLLLDRDRRLGKLLARWRRLTIGLAIDGTAHRLRLRDAQAWYDEADFDQLEPR